MKKIFLALAFLSTVLVSCEKEITESKNCNCYKLDYKIGISVVNPNNPNGLPDFQGTIHLKNICSGNIVTHKTQDKQNFDAYRHGQLYCGTY